MKTLSVLALSCLLLGGIGCTAGQSELAEVTELSPGQVTRHLAAGTTTQKDVVLALGSPNMVIAGSGKGDVWVYDQIRVERNTDGYSAAAFLVAGFPLGSESFGGSGGGVGGSGSREISSVKTLSVVIEFIATGVVSKYDVISTSF